MKAFFTLASFAIAADASGIPARSKFQYTAPTNPLQNIFENGSDESFARVTKQRPKEVEEPMEKPRFHQVSEEEYHDFDRGMKAIKKLLKPESLEILKQVSSIATQHAEKNPSTDSLTPQKLAGLVQSAMANQPEGFNYDRLNHMLDKWKKNMFQTPLAAMQKMQSTDKSENASQRQQQPAQNQQIPAGQDPSFAQIQTIPGMPSTPDFQAPQPMPMQYMQYMMPSPAPIEEFSNPMQAQWAFM